MLWLKHGDPVLFRTQITHAFEPGTWNEITNGINDQFGMPVHGSGITYEGTICDPTLPGTYVGLEGFCTIAPKEYSIQAKGGK